MLSWNIGHIRIHSIVETDAATSPRFLFKDISKQDVLTRAERAPWLRPHFVSDEGFLLQTVQCLVIETPTIVIAVDTCVGNDKQRANPGWNELQIPFLERMAAAGFPPERVDIVVCTHLHVDHVGWNTRLVDGEWVPTFPNARYLFVDAEFTYAEAHPDHGNDSFPDSVAPIATAGLADLVAPDHVICDGVRLEPTHGHTPGHVSVAIESDGERAVITGDMTHTPLQIADPDLSSMFDTDPDEARRCRHAAFTRWSAAGALVIGTHFGAPTAGYLRRSEAGDGTEPDASNAWVFDAG